MACILVADDEPLVRSTLRDMLERAGYDVVEARDGDEALRACRSGHPDLALIDIVMPNREGLETIAELRQTSVIPIVAMSGGGATRSRSFLDCAAEIGANRSLSKPVRNTDLLQAIAECLAEEAAGPC